MKRSFRLSVQAILTITAALIFGAFLPGCPTENNSNSDIGYTITVDNVTPSLTFIFDSASSPTDLHAKDIILTGHSGRVSKKGDLSLENGEWKLNVEVHQYGTVKVKIAKDGVDGGEKLIAIPEPVIGYTVKADESSYLTFTFEKLVNLQLGDIELIEYSGKAHKVSNIDSLTPVNEFDLTEPPYYEKTWKLRIMVEKPGMILARINKAGIDNNPKPVQVYNSSTSGSWNYGEISDEPGLYVGDSITPKSLDGGFTLTKAFTYINSQPPAINSQPPADYTYIIVLEKDVSYTEENVPSLIPQTLDITVTLIAVQEREVTITLDSGKFLTINKNITFVLGPGITLKGTAGSQVSVEKNGTFKMQPEATITGNTAVLVKAGGKFLMSGGSISENVGAVTVSKDAVFTMTGGEISKNTGGGGVAVNVNGTFTMSGGEISGNTGKGVSVNSNAGFIMTGGTISDFSKDDVRIKHTYGVYIASNASFTMRGGSIAGSTSSGVYVASNASFTMTDGSISGNAAGVKTSGTFTMTGGSVSGNADSGVDVSAGKFAMSGGYISGNKSNGVKTSGEFTMTGGSVSGNADSGVKVDSPALFKMTGGNISGNTSSGNGGGVNVDSSYTAQNPATSFGFIMSGGNISGNTSSDSGGGVFVSDAGAFMMMGGEISGNTAFYKGSHGGGGGVYAVGRFVKTQGTIYGYSNTDGNKVITGSYELSRGRGHAAYVEPARVFDEDIGPDMPLD
ncbi:MAG: right-handed parallel beta-helix repeat-containing protein [Spirochaetaceae bacterium]|jgi:hypothetical protein|nr:right-handed parallel beta-helix repeat-containing protein [Spirochaetaceae bacterium]